MPRDKTIRMGRDPLRESFVLRQHDLAREVAIGRIPPEVVNGQRLHVHALLIHDLQALRAEEVVAAAAAHFLERRALDDVQNGYHAVRVPVDNLDAPPADRDLAARPRCLCEQTAVSGQVWH